VATQPGVPIFECFGQGDDPALPLADLVFWAPMCTSRPRSGFFYFGDIYLPIRTSLFRLKDVASRLVFPPVIAVCLIRRRYAGRDRAMIDPSPRLV